MGASKWILHVKATHKKLGGSYSSAMKAASKTWKKTAGGTEKKKTQKTKKEVRFADDEEDEKADLGGAIRKPKTKDVAVDVKRIQMSEPLIEPEGQYDEDSDSTDDEEAAAYSHFGGRLSGRGLAYDPPDVAQAVMKSLSGHPELMHTYVQGRVPAPRRYEDHYGNSESMRPYASRDAGASIIDYGGSLAAITHYVDGYLVAHDPHFPHEFHIV